MVISSVRLQNFRNYLDSTFEFNPRVNLIVGPNAVGKTNLLESILVLANGSSYRGKDIDLIKSDQPWARVDGVFDNSNRTAKVENTGQEVKKTFDIDSKLYSRLGFSSRLPVVLFEPNHLNLITRGPEQRREYIDELIGKSQKDLRTVMNKYRRVLSQRNSLLKKPEQRSKEEIFVWNIRLAELGAQIALARARLVDDINLQIGELYSSISKTKAQVMVDYASHFPVNNYASKMLAKLDKDTQLDFVRGFTAHGPHREDFVVKINQKNIAQSASRGETRSVVLALKIFELSLLEAVTGEKPIFLLDDVFSELDSARRKALVAILKKHQSVLTTTDADIIKKYFKPNQVKIIKLAI